MRFSLRPYAHADWPALLALWIEAWTKTRPDIDFVARGPWLESLFADSLAKDAHVVVAEDKHGLLGSRALRAGAAMAGADRGGPARLRLRRGPGLDRTG